MHFARHPLWLVGFRPFFILACLAGALLPAGWVALLSGTPPALPVAPLQWHAHEMFYAYGWAGLGGFLLTASKNWVGVRGWHGGALILLVLAWWLDRSAMYFGAGWPPLAFWLASGLFQTAIVAMLLWTLFVQRVRGQESDNYYFWIILPLFLPAKFLLLDGGHFAYGWGMTLALFRVAFLLMIERTQVQFMRLAFQVEILRNARLDHAIKILGIAAVFAEWLPGPLAAGLELALAGLLLGRLAFWHPRLALSRLDIGVMYLGYLFIVAQLLVAGLGRVVELPWVGSVKVHLFALGTLGLILPAMIVRIAKGHTGRPVVFEAGDKIVLWLLLAGLAGRLLAPQLLPAAYALWLQLTAACWAAAFGLLLWRFLPLLLAPRVDGKEH